jgi:manganese transport protein
MPLVMLTSRRDIMGIHVNGRTTIIIAWTVAIIISLLNVFLLYQQFFGS